MKFQKKSTAKTTTIKAMIVFNLYVYLFYSWHKSTVVYFCTFQGNRFSGQLPHKKPDSPETYKSVLLPSIFPSLILITKIEIHTSKNHCIHVSIVRNDYVWPAIEFGRRRTKIIEKTKTKPLFFRSIRKKSRPIMSLCICICIFTVSWIHSHGIFIDRFSFSIICHISWSLHSSTRTRIDCHDLFVRVSYRIFPTFH